MCEWKKALSLSLSLFLCVCVLLWLIDWAVIHTAHWYKYEDIEEKKERKMKDLSENEIKLGIVHIHLEIRISLAWSYEWKELF